MCEPADSAGPYLQITLGTIGLISGAGVSTFILRAAGDAMQAMIAFMSGTAVTLMLQPVLIAGWLGVPAMGLAGAAIALAAGRGFVVLVVLGP